VHRRSSSLSTEGIANAFSDELLSRTRHALAEAIELNIQDADTVEEWQPFHLQLIAALAAYGDDIVTEYPKDVATGVPLGVTSPTWTSPGVWHTEQNFKGETTDWDELLTPVGRDNLPLGQGFLLPRRSSTKMWMHR
jgi:hypothetical protein